MKVLSLFSGCGGLDLGLIQSGHEIVFANDFDKDCKLTYETNIGKHFVLEDIKNLHHDSLPKYDLLVGGFPCQGFSIANIHRSISDKRNELYLELVRILSETKPKYFLAENVPGILSLDKGKIVNMILQDFRNAGMSNNFPGYEVKIFVLNAVNYGVPQNRKRVIFLGISKEFSNSQRNLFFSNFPPDYKNENGRLDLSPLKTLKDAIYDLPEPATTDANKYKNHFGLKHKVIINGYIGNRVLDWNLPSPTIVGRGGGTGGPVIPVHPNLKRRLTVRETARIQTFPDNFEFLGSISSQFRQIGNAVAVEFARNLGVALKNYEDNKLDTKKAPLMLELDY